MQLESELTYCKTASRRPQLSARVRLAGTSESRARHSFPHRSLSCRHVRDSTQILFFAPAASGNRAYSSEYCRATTMHRERATRASLGNRWQNTSCFDGAYRRGECAAPRDRYHTRSASMQFPASILSHSQPRDFDETIARPLGRSYATSGKITTSVARLLDDESSDDVDLAEGKCTAARAENNNGGSSRDYVNTTRIEIPYACC